MAALLPPWSCQNNSIWWNEAITGTCHKHARAVLDEETFVMQPNVIMRSLPPHCATTECCRKEHSTLHG
jgi:hypothetical protein